MQAIIHAADIQDRDGGVLLMGALSTPPRAPPELRIGSWCRSKGPHSIDVRPLFPILLITTLKSNTRYKLVS